MAYREVCITVIKEILLRGDIHTYAGSGTGRVLERKPSYIDKADRYSSRVNRQFLEYGQMHPLNDTISLFYF